MEDKNLLTKFIIKKDDVLNQEEAENILMKPSVMKFNFSSEQDDLYLYAKSIEKLAHEKDTETFFNSGKDHAAIVMANIFKFSKKEIKIFAGNFCGDVSSQQVYLDGLKMFLDAGGKITIILEEYIRQNNEQLFDLLAMYQYFNPDQVNVSITSARVLDESHNKKIHFTIGDDSIYRLEEDTDNFSARGSFNNPTESKKLLNFFDSIQRQYSTNVSIN